VGTFKEKIDITDFTIEGIDISQLDKVSDWLPKNGVIDLNIAEQGLFLTLHAQNFCQEQIVKVDRIIGVRESEKNRAWSRAALDKALAAGHKTIKNKEWFALSDDDYIDACNRLTMAKACKRYFENKASHFSGWHYAFKTFLKRDYDLERLGNLQANGYNNREINSLAGHELDEAGEVDMGGDVEW
jgi:hypothetical protein